MAADAGFPPENPGWRDVLLGVDPRFNRFARIMRRMPGAPRCHFCGAPFGGVGAPLARATSGGIST